jgi:hypothetical protein
MDQAEARLDVIAEQIANQLDLGGDHLEAGNQHPPSPPQ